MIKSVNLRKCFLVAFAKAFRQPAMGSATIAMYDDIVRKTGGSSKLFSTSWPPESSDVGTARQVGRVETPVPTSHKCRAYGKELLYSGNGHGQMRIMTVDIGAKNGAMVSEAPPELFRMRVSIGGRNRWVGTADGRNSSPSYPSNNGQPPAST